MIFFLENSLKQFEMVQTLNLSCELGLNLSTISMQNVKKETENSFRHLLNET